MCLHLVSGCDRNLKKAHSDSTSGSGSVLSVLLEVGNNVSFVKSKNTLTLSKKKKKSLQVEVIYQK